MVCIVIFYFYLCLNYLLIKGHAITMPLAFGMAGKGLITER